MTDLKTSELIFTWHRSVGEIAQAYEACLGTTDINKSVLLQQAIELSKLPDVELHYLVGHDATGPQCVIPCYKGRLSLLVLASPQLQKFSDGMRKIFPGFLDVKLFCVGSAVSTCGDLLGFRDASNTAIWTPSRVRSVFDEVTRYGRSLKIGFFLIKEFNDTLKAFLEAAIGPRLIVVESLPVASLTLQEPSKGAYPETICSKYRNKYKKRVAVADETGITWDIRPTCAGLEDRVYDLYCQVVDHSDYVFERVNRDFFVRVPELMGPKAFFVMGFLGADKKLISCEMVLIGSDRLDPVYSGFDYSIKAQSDVYFNGFYKLIECTEKNNFRILQLGQTAYEVKAELGATCSKLWIAVFHTNPLMHWLISKFQAALSSHVDFPYREVFKIAPPAKKTQRKGEAAANTTIEPKTPVQD